MWALCNFDFSCFLKNIYMNSKVKSIKLHLILIIYSLAEICASFSGTALTYCRFEIEE